MANQFQLGSFFVRDGRLRPTLRVILYLVLVFTLIVFIAQSIVALTLAAGLVTTADLYASWIAGPGGIVRYGANLLSLLVVTFAARRLIDKKSFGSLGFARTKGWWVDGLVGLAMGIGLIALVFAIELVSGLITVESFGTAATEDRIGGLISIGVIFVMVAFSEELMTRGYILQNLAEDWGLPIAVFVSSAFFGFLHIDNPNVSTLAIINVFLGGLFFSGAYLATRNLWLPMALHFGWNFAQGPLFGFRVSGVETPVLTSIEQQGTELITGGGFGPEGGLIILIPLTVGAALLWYWNRARRNVLDINVSESYDDGVEANSISSSHSHS